MTTTARPLPADHPYHGTTTGYARPYRCRCPRCRAANTAWHAQRKEERRRLLVEGADVEHGRYTTYNNWACGCDPCTDAYNAYQRDYKARKRHRTSTTASITTGQHPEGA